ncbi:outer membrane protein assembly factor BamA [Methylobacterium haplocladii]|uniref:Outer membrane protein assembly factor BamA n=1 Tax=Methylobacterium haplocladii TaxID=1176176 RepID=A0A512IJX5_9HYPH|nr:outer membrane protein assembly factor BamA [Methylobacterium haplocladii]GEO97984.1 outer membrane protein assembly factor BamA [Methylobacterium haplocladii]GJD86035.1 Outer membrane protein assembly factor BamA [Methylobacterium haplocladii]GLS57885.1 outer membrane protein assembly factor BamA [Methylobacterium haplocladii]
MMSMTGIRRRKSAERTIVLIASAAAGVVLGGAAYAQQIVVEGNRRVEADTIRSYVTGTASGSPEEARRSLLSTGLFSDVQVSARGGTTVVRVRENNVIGRVFFEGNKKLEKTTLQGVVESKDRGALSNAVIAADVERIRETYRRSGRGGAKVTYRLVDLPNGRTDVVFQVDEGDKTGVREIVFVNNNAFSESTLKGLMTTSEMNFLSFIKTSDVYDPDRIASDLEIVRRYYLRNGYADFRVVNADARYVDGDGEAGWVVTVTVEEGEQYTVGAVSVDSRVPGVDQGSLDGEIRAQVGDVYNAEDVEKTLSGVTTEVNRQGYPFAQVRPTGQRDRATHQVALGFVVEDGPRVYIERINVRGNTRTRDYVIRRELDLGEGDAYNRVLVDRAERRLNGLGFFKKVRFSNEPGSAPDRVVVNIDVEDQPTGSFSVSGGYSTQDGIIGEVSVSESNFLGRGQYVRIAGTGGQYAKGVDFSFTEPYFLGYRLAAGFDAFYKYSDLTRYSRYETTVYGGQLRIGLPITQELGVTFRYSLYNTELTVPNTLKRPYNDCSVPIPGYTVLNPAGTIDPTTGLNVSGLAAYPNCAYDGEASIALKGSQGNTLTSLVGATLAYSTLDNIARPTNGFYGEIKPDIAGLGGDSKFFRVTGDARYYKEIYEDVVGFVRIQGGHISALNDEPLRITDQFFLGPSLVRGFAPNGIGPRDVGTSDARSNAIGGTTYFGGTLEVQFPIPGIPKDLGLKGAVFADAGTLFGYSGRTQFNVNGDAFINGTPQGAGGICNYTSIGAGATRVEPECVNVRDKPTIRSSVGASILWNSPLGPIRFDYAYALSKDEGVQTAFGRVGKDQIQAFRFSGGSRF